MIPGEWINQARERIKTYIKKTPLTFDPDHNIFIKWENKQVTGSFKVRGALNKVLSLQPWEREKGIVAASAGNHGQGVALAGSLTNTSVTVFIPEQTPKIKIESMENLGAHVHLVSGGYEAAEIEGARYAAGVGSVWISPYNDGQVIAGQGTITLEIMEELSNAVEMVWVVPASGGGLAAGIGLALRSQKENSNLVAVQSDTSPFLYSIFHHGSQDGIRELPTIAEGLAGPVEKGSVTIPIVKNIIDNFYLVSEDKIKQAIAYCWYKYSEQIEGAAAVSLAAVLDKKITSRPAILIISGGNIQPEFHQEITRDFAPNDLV